MEGQCGGSGLILHTGLCRALAESLTHTPRRGTIDPRAKRKPQKLLSRDGGFKTVREQP